MPEPAYIGWSNYETWCVNLWLTNEVGSAEVLEEIANRQNQSTETRATDLQAWVTSFGPQTGDMYSDLLHHALDNVNWREIIENHQETQRLKPWKQ